MQIRVIHAGLLGVNCYIAENEETKECVVVDPGGSVPGIDKVIRENGLTVKAILLTHGHYDHTGGLDKARALWKVPVYADEKEKRVLKDPMLNMSGHYRGMPDISTEADVWLTDGQEFTEAGFTFRMIHTPGHTEGSCCFYDEKDHVLFSGDTLFRGSYGRIDLPTGNGRDMLHSVVDVLFQLPEDTQVLPGHEGITTIGDELGWNPLASYIGQEPDFWEV